MLARLLHPYSVHDFHTRIRERRHLHVTAGENPALAGLYDELLTLDDMDALLTVVYGSGQRKADALRMGQSGVMIAPDRFLRNRNGQLAEVDVGRVLELHRAGASIIMNAVHTALEPVAALCTALSTELGVHVHANVYITPREAQGFPVHFDAHDVFLLQVAGEKVWRLADSSMPLATSEAHDPAQLSPAGPETTVRLRPGELLYIPRGMLHEGVATTEMSAHLTIGINPLTWAQVLHEMVRRLELSDVEFRRSVSVVGSAPPELAAVAERLGGSADLLAETVRDLVAENTTVGAYALRGQLRSMHEAAVTLDTPVRLRPGVTPRIACDGEVTVDFGSGVLTVPAYAELQVAALCSGRSLRGRDIPPGLDEAGRLALIRRMLREGLLVTTPESASA